jgi:hypothetical protein
MDKRTFLKSATLVGIGGMLSLDGLAELFKSVSAVPAAELAGDEDFWTTIRKGYRLKPDFINLENGYYNFVPEQVLEKFIEHVREINFQASYYMRTVQWDNKKAMAAKLATIAGCPADEIGRAHV